MHEGVRARYMHGNLSAHLGAAGCNDMADVLPVASDQTGTKPWWLLSVPGSCWSRTGTCKRAEGKKKKKTKKVKKGNNGVP